mgnify:CR=1 FL=1
MFYIFPIVYSWILSFYCIFVTKTTGEHENRQKGTKGFYLIFRSIKL